MSYSTDKTSGVSVHHDHIVLCPFPFFTHPATLLHLGRKIAATLPHVRITLLTTVVSAMYLHTYLPFQDEPKILILHIDDGLEGQYNRDSVEELMANFMKVAGESIRKGIEYAEEFFGLKMDFLVADALISHVCQEIAEERGVKWVALWNSAAGALAAHMFGDDLKRKIGVEGFPTLPATDLPDQVHAADKSPTIAQLLKDMRLSLPKTAAVLINSFDHLESGMTGFLNDTFKSQFLNAGPYFLTLSYKTVEHLTEFVLPWLDTHINNAGSVVYISYGAFYTVPINSSIIPTKEEIKALAEGLEAAGVPFIWYLPLYYHPYLPEGFIDRNVKTGKGKLLTFGTHMSVLNHAAVGAQFTDCLWESVSESIVTGVPMICWPYGPVDGMSIHKRLVEFWRIGLTVEGEKLTKSTVARALKRMMLEEEGRNMRENIRLLKKTAEEAAVEPNGSSTQNVKKFINIILN